MSNFRVRKCHADLFRPFPEIFFSAVKMICKIMFVKSIFVLLTIDFSMAGEGFCMFRKAR